MAAMVAVMFVAVSAVARAQDPQQQGKRSGRGPSPVAVLKDSLHVSDAVATKADSIWKAYQTVAQPLMEAARGGDADARTKVGEARTKATDAIKALLTDEQKAQFDKVMPQRGGRPPAGR